jgi:hypothetical protein
MGVGEGIGIEVGGGMVGVITIPWRSGAPCAKGQSVSLRQ